MGFRKGRIVLLKFFDENSFVFFTNYNSEKGKSLEKNSKVGLHFFWPELERQIRISGLAEKTSAEVSDKYFFSRPEASRIGAIVSPQSSEIPNRQFLHDRFNTFQKETTQIIRPETWGGYSVFPVKFEFLAGPRKPGCTIVFCLKKKMKPGSLNDWLLDICN